MTLGANQIGAYAADLLDLEEQIDALQDSKRDLYKAIRDEHGKGEAKSLKRAVQLSRMDAGKRDEAEAVDTEAQRMLKIIEASRAPRATPARANTVPEHEPAHSEPSGVAADQDESEDSPALSSTPLQEGSEPAEAHNLGSERSTRSPATQPGEGEAGSSPATAASPPAGEGAGAPSSADKPFQNSKGLWRQPGCQNPETCAGTWRARCSSCERAFNAEPATLNARQTA
jgi:hypothetical protein